mgnify:CR=1 FL=1
MLQFNHNLLMERIKLQMAFEALHRRRPTGAYAAIGRPLRGVSRRTLRRLALIPVAGEPEYALHRKGTGRLAAKLTPVAIKRYTHSVIRVWPKPKRNRS